MGIVRALKELFGRGNKGLKDSQAASGKPAANAGEADVGSTVREIQRKLMNGADENAGPGRGRDGRDPQRGALPGPIGAEAFRPARGLEASPLQAPRREALPGTRQSKKSPS